MESKNLNQMSVNIPNFNGPLGSSGWQKHKVNLAEISVAKLADQFLEFVKNNKPY